MHPFFASFPSFFWSFYVFCFCLCLCSLFQQKRKWKRRLITLIYTKGVDSGSTREKKERNRPCSFFLFLFSSGGNNSGMTQSWKVCSQARLMASNQGSRRIAKAVREKKRAAALAQDAAHAFTVNLSAAEQHPVRLEWSNPGLATWQQRNPQRKENHFARERTSPQQQ